LYFRSDYGRQSVHEDFVQIKLPIFKKNVLGYGCFLWASLRGIGHDPSFLVAETAQVLDDASFGSQSIEGTLFVVEVCNIALLE
jgi:hypothetical protein